MQASYNVLLPRLLHKNAHVSYLEFHILPINSLHTVRQGIFEVIKLRRSLEIVISMK